MHTLCTRRCIVYRFYWIIIPIHHRRHGGVHEADSTRFIVNLNLERRPYVFIGCCETKKIGNLSSVDIRTIADSMLRDQFRLLLAK
jgi:hypothetical protein